MGQIDDLFWQLIEQEHNRAVRYCGRLTGNTDEGDDLYQDSVIRAFDGFETLRQAASFRPWFYRIINNTYKGRFRTGWWKRFVSRPREVENSDLVVDPTGWYEAKRRLEYALSALSTDDRTIVILAELEDWSISDLADLMNGTEGFVKMRLSRSRKKMRARLGRVFREVQIRSHVREEQATHAVPTGPTETD
jgi:RNA polymerase sigma-70 factor (ECF subfamily)